MTDPSWTGVVKAQPGTFEATCELKGCHPGAIFVDYSLLPGDVLVERPDGSFYKFGPGLGIEGFVLTDEQRETLKPLTEDVPFGIGGLDYFVEGL